MRRLAVLSDGAAALVEYQLANWLDLLNTLEHPGPAELIHKIRAAQASDPAGTRWPRFKQGDDATVAFCLLS